VDLYSAYTWHLQCAEHTNTGRRNVLSVRLNVNSVQPESLSWSGSKFQTVGPATENARRPNVLRSAGNDLQNVVADDWRCLKLEISSLPDTVVLCRNLVVGFTSCQIVNH